MYSKAGKLREMIIDQNDASDAASEAEENLKALDQKIREQEKIRDENDYTSLPVLLQTADDIISYTREKEDEEARKHAAWQVRTISRDRERLTLDFQRFSGWVTQGRITESVTMAKPRLFQNEGAIRIQDAPLVARKDGWPKYVLLGLLFVVAAPAVLVFLALRWFADNFLDSELLGWVLTILLTLAAGMFWLTFISDKMAGHPFLQRLPLLIIVLTIAFLAVQAAFSRKALRENGDLFLAIRDPEEYERRCYQAHLANFERISGSNMAKDRAEIAAGGDNSLKQAAVNTLKEDYDSAVSAIGQMRAQQQELQDLIQANNEEIDRLSEMMNNAAESVFSPVDDPDHNEGVLTEFIARKRENGVFQTVWHGAKPFVFTYDPDKYDTQQELMTAIAQGIQSIYYGLIHDNYFGLIDFLLMDLDTGGAILSNSPEARKLFESEVIRVIRSNADREECYRMLRAQRDVVFGIDGTGDIRTTNPRRIAEGDEPLPYHVVMHYGKEAARIGSEVMQLYQGADRFGFLPFFILSQAEYDDVLDNEANPLHTVLLSERGYAQID